MKEIACKSRNNTKIQTPQHRRWQRQTFLTLSRRNYLRHKTKQAARSDGYLMPLSTILYNFPFRTLPRPCRHLRKTAAITLTTPCEPHCSNAIDTATLPTTTTRSVILAENGSVMSVNTTWMGFGGARSTNMLKTDRTIMENINQPICYMSEISSLMSVACRNAPFVHIDLRYGGPMLKTAATRIYWKHEMTKSTVFSKLVDSRLLPSEAGSFAGGSVYLYTKLVLFTFWGVGRSFYHGCFCTHK